MRHCIEVAGEADLATVAGAEGSSDRGDRRRCAASVLVDFSGASFIDSTALGVLMGAVKRLRPIGGEVAIVCTDPNIRRTFEMTLLDRIFKIFETPEPALAYVQALAQPASASS